MGISRKREEQHADRRGPHQARADACHRDGALRVRKDLPPAGSRTDAGSCVAVRNCPWSTGTVCTSQFASSLASRPRDTILTTIKTLKRDPSLSRTAETRVTFPRSVRGASAATRKVRPAKLAKLQARTLTVTRSHGTSAIEPNPKISDFLFFRKFVHSTLCICTCTKSNSILSWAYGSGRRQASREVSSLVTRG